MNPLVEALRAVAEHNLSEWHVATKFGQINRRPTGCFAVVSYEDAFKGLWGMLDDGANDAKTWLGEYPELDHTIAIVDDRSPAADLLRTNNFASPFDWALAISLKLRGQAPPLRVMILRPEQFPFASADSFKRFAAVSRCLPWVQCYGAIGADLDYLDAVKNDAAVQALRSGLRAGTLGFQALANEIAYPNRQHTMQSAFARKDVDTGEELDAAATVWRAAMVKPGDRHALSNFIGVETLSRQLGRRVSEDEKDRTGSVERNAVALLAAQIGALQRSSTTHKPPRLKEKAEGVAFFPRETRFLLVDDQFELGYGRLLAYALWGGSRLPDSTTASLRYGEGRLDCYATVDELLRLIPNASVADWSMPLVLGGDDAETRIDGVFLDLRLWTDETKEQKNSAPEVLKTILAKAQAIGLHACGDESVAKAIASIEKGEVKGTSPITLLPLLLSHYDASLPIVLFSSAHDRAVIERLQHRPNIITVFAKPILSEATGEGDEASRLGKAIDELVRMQPARHLWRRLSRETVRKMGRPPFELSADEVRRRVARIVVDHLVRDEVFYGLSAPGEFLEAFRLYDDFELCDIGGGLSNELRPWAAALKVLRNWRVHGTPWKAGMRTDESARAALRLAVAILIEILCVAKRAGGGAEPQLAGRKSRAIAKLCFSASSATVEPGEATRLGNVPLNEFWAGTLLAARLGDQMTGVKGYKKPTPNTYDIALGEAALIDACRQYVLAAFP